MKIHILGICGTFMGGLAVLAKQSGHRVSGSDRGIYPPMSDLLRDSGIDILKGFDPQTIPPDTDLVIIGNALSRGNPAVEHVLNERIAYTSGAAWLGQHYLRHRKVLAVAGTHGKTTTSSMLAWILESAGLNPGFLIGGKPGNFDVSARDGDDYFVIEADEYDTAFFDKRSKFVHYHPHVAILNNLEFDHADIFPDLAAIQRQFHHLLRVVPANGQVIVNGSDTALGKVIDMGCWAPVVTFAAQDSGWRTEISRRGAGEIITPEGDHHPVRWAVAGEHNLLNATAAVAAARAIGIKPERAIESLSEFKLPGRRLEVVSECDGRTIIDDFAHHPTAIVETVKALRLKYPDRPITAVLDPSSNTMRQGAHLVELVRALREPDHAWVVAGDRLIWAPEQVFIETDVNVVDTVDELIHQLPPALERDAVIVMMSNASFDNATKRLVAAL